MVLLTEFWSLFLQRDLHTQTGIWGHVTSYGWSSLLPEIVFCQSGRKLFTSATSQQLPASAGAVYRSFAYTYTSTCFSSAGPWNPSPKFTSGWYVIMGPSRPLDSWNLGKQKFFHRATSSPFWRTLLLVNEVLGEQFLVENWKKNPLLILLKNKYLRTALNSIHSIFILL